MTTQTITLNLPAALYQRLRQRALQTHRSLEDEVLEVLATAVPIAEDLPADLAEAITPLSVLDDRSLWQAARTRFPSELAQQLEALHLKRQREGLTESEAESVALLIRQYERVMLVRAQAAALLKQRGYDITPLLNAA